MSDCLDQPYQLPFVCHQFGVVWHDLATEERYRPAALVEDGALARARGVTLHHEIAIEIRQLQHRGGRQGPLQVVECHLRVVRPLEPRLAQKTGKRFGDGPVVLDEMPIVSSEAEEAVYITHRPWSWPI
jgi:hypothetical protein